MHNLFTPPYIRIRTKKNVRVRTGYSARALWLITPKLSTFIVMCASATLYSYNAGKCVACGLKNVRPSHVTIVLASQLFTFTLGMRCLGHNTVWKSKLPLLTGLVGQVH